MIYTTIADAYNSLIKGSKTWQSVYDTPINRGSFENTETIRRQFMPLMLTIIDPLDFTILPLGITQGAVEQYYQNYIIGCTPKARNEAYKYSDRIAIQLPHVISMLTETPQTNQAAISVSRPEDIVLPDPPCLREITFKVIPNKGLQLTSFWRSNDLDSAFTFNQCSMALLLRDVAEASGQKVYRMVYVSDGLHSYRF